jgi:hypothetical protein
MPRSASDERQRNKKTGVFAFYNSVILFVYNVTQFIGWLCVLMRIINLFFFKWDSQVEFLKASYRDTGFLVLLLQQLSCLEIVFVFVGILKTPLMNIFMQLLARNIVVLFVVQYTDSEKILNSPAIFLYTISWCLADTPRYLWLIIKCFISCGPRCERRLASLFSILNYIRYTWFIILYPVGGLGEGWTMFNAYGLNIKRIVDLPFSMPSVGIKHEHYELDMDFIIKYVYFPLYIPGFLFLYFHMLKQRSRKIPGNVAADRKMKKK